jgi:hypothetical protein
VFCSNGLPAVQYWYEKNGEAGGLSGHADEGGISVESLLSISVYRH